MEDKTYFLTCDCHSNEHIARFTYLQPNKENEPLEIFLSVHLCDHKKWHKRLWAGIKYIFGYNSVYGNWDEIILNEEKILELQKFLSNVKWIHK